MLAFPGLQVPHRRSLVLNQELFVTRNPATVRVLIFPLIADMSSKVSSRCWVVPISLSVPGSVVNTLPRAVEAFALNAR